MALRIPSLAVSTADRLARSNAAFSDWWATLAPWYAGRIAKQLQRVRIEECVFDVTSPTISTFQAGMLALGRYEWQERTALRSFLDPDLAVIDCGASIGVLSCLANGRLHRPERHIAIEANPLLIPILNSNRDLNRRRFRVEHGALAYGTDTVSFGVESDFLISSVSSHHQQQVDVPALRLRDVINKYDCQPCTLLCDIEGAEHDMLRNEEDVLQRCVRWLIIETHKNSAGADLHADVFGLLTSGGFTHMWSEETTHVFRRRE
jgi:FkbM family methyltransferase